MKYTPGDVVYIRSAYEGGGQGCTVLMSYEALGSGEERISERGKLVGPAPATYDLVMVKKDGGGLCTFTMPEHALCVPELAS